MRITYDTKVSLEVGDDGTVKSVAVCLPYMRDIPSDHDDPTDGDGERLERDVWVRLNAAPWPTDIEWVSY